MPSPVDKYYDEVKKGNPSYSDEQAWATAWSIYCKHKNPGSDSCHKPTSEYLKNASLRVVARFLEASDGGALQQLKQEFPQLRHWISEDLLDMLHSTSPRHILVAVR
jgi:hypothetical protein